MPRRGAARRGVDRWGGLSARARRRGEAGKAPIGLARPRRFPPFKCAPTWNSATTRPAHPSLSTKRARCPNAELICRFIRLQQRTQPQDLDSEREVQFAFLSVNFLHHHPYQRPHACPHRCRCRHCRHPGACSLALASPSCSRSPSPAGHPAAHQWSCSVALKSYESLRSRKPRPMNACRPLPSSTRSTK